MELANQARTYIFLNELENPNGLKVIKNEETGLPEKIQLFKPGANLTTHIDEVTGKQVAYYYDPEMAEEMLSKWKERGLTAGQFIDVEHMAFDPFAATPEAKANVGMFDQLLDETGAWADTVRFNPIGEGYIRNKQFAYTSPAFDIAKEVVLDENGEAILDDWGNPMVRAKVVAEDEKTITYLITEIINFSLVNNPGTIGSGSLLSKYKHKLKELFMKQETPTKLATDEQVTEQVNLATQKLQNQLSELQEQNTLLKDEIAKLKEKEEELEELKTEKLKAEKADLLKDTQLSDKQKATLLKMDVEDIKDFLGDTKPQDKKEPTFLKGKAPIEGEEKAPVELSDNVKSALRYAGVPFKSGENK